jgi:hypothetical protein
MCNAWNHPPDCRCGWGGDGHIGGGGGGSAPTRGLPPLRLTQSPVQGSLTRWEFAGEDFTRQSRCPVCGAYVYFVRHNGGSMYFDDLGSPWPKHGCFDVSAESKHRIPRELWHGGGSVVGVGVVMGARAEIGYVNRARLDIRCTCADLPSPTVFQNVADAESFLGLFVVVSKSGDSISVRGVTDYGVVVECSASIDEVKQPDRLRLDAPRVVFGQQPAVTPSSSSIVVCSGCGARLKQKRLQHHLNSRCPAKFGQQPAATVSPSSFVICSGCGARLKQKRLQGHLNSRCPARARVDRPENWERKLAIQLANREKNRDNGSVATWRRLMGF